jgi:hypothetical protein
MKSRFTSLLVAGCLVMIAACDSAAPTESNELEAPGASGGRVVSSTELSEFLPSGDVGGGVLEAGLFFPPTEGSESKLTRTQSFVEYTINTTGLPPGAYTVWMVVINEPGDCLTSPCTTFDVFGRTAEVDASAFWSAGEIVHASGRGYFKARIAKGYFPTVVDQIAWPGSGLQNPMGGEFHLIVKYHGPASDDPAVLYEQTHTLLGSCFEGANALDLGEPLPGVVFGVQCFDPQVAVHAP